MWVAPSRIYPKLRSACFGTVSYIVASGPVRAFWLIWAPTPRQSRSMQYGGNGQLRERWNPRCRSTLDFGKIFGIVSPMVRLMFSQDPQSLCQSGVHAYVLDAVGLSVGLGDGIN